MLGLLRVGVRVVRGLYEDYTSHWPALRFSQYTCPSTLKPSTLAPSTLIPSTLLAWPGVIVGVIVGVIIGVIIGVRAGGRVVGCVSKKYSPIFLAWGEKVT